MAGKKKKKKDKKNLSGSLSHIASHLVPSAIFAAVPRTATPLSSTWPRTTPSPVAKAVGEAGNLGFALVGDIHRPSSQGELGADEGLVKGRPPADLPSTSQQFDEDPAYESVDVATRSNNFDKTTKFYRMRNDGESRTEEQSEPNDHFYHVLETEKQVDEPVYSKVDKTKKKSALTQNQLTEQQMNDDDVVPDYDVISSDEDLTDVTSNDEDSSISSKARAKEMKRKFIQKDQKENPKLQKSRRQNKDDDTSEENSFKRMDSLISEQDKLPQEEQESNPGKSDNDSTIPYNTKTKKSVDQLVKTNSIDAHQEEDHSKEILVNKPSLDSEKNPLNTKRGSKKSSLKKRAQVAPEEEKVNGNTNSHDELRSNYECESPDKEVRHLERLGFEGVSQKVGLSDISEDEESYLLKLSEQSKFEHQRTQFEKETFNETLSDSFDTNVEEVQLVESGNFDFTEASPDSLPWSNSQEEYRINHGPKKSSDRLGQIGTVKEYIFIQQQKHLEQLIRQQEDVYRQQAEQQQQQQKQSEKLAQQQQELQGQLKLLEQIQYGRLQGQLNVSSSSALSDCDVKLQKEMVEQQEQILRTQQEQQMHYEHQQERILQLQENLCNQIRQLELQQKELQFNISSLTPKEKDLAEIRWQEQEIIRLLNEQKSHQEQYEHLHRQQLQKIQEKELSFQQERQSLQIQQDVLKTKIIEQEEKSKKLEELLYVSSKDRVHQSSAVVEDLHSVSYNDEVDAIMIPKGEAKKSSKTNKRIHEVLSENTRLLEINASLQQENAVLKQFNEALQKGSAGGSSLVVQQQVKELQQENKVLQETVHRLNVELSRYQTKYRKATVEDFQVILSKTSDKQTSPWLVNTKFLAPLFLAYDDRLKEREDIIKTYDEKLTSFKARLMEIVKENQDLHIRLTQSKPNALDLDEWQQLQEQAKLVVEENALLMKQQDQQQRKIKEQQRSHGQDVSKLSMRIATIESEKRRLETELEDSHRNYTNLSQKYKDMVAEEDTKINVEVHLSMINELRSVMEDLKAKKHAEMEDLESRLNVIQVEKHNLASSLADSKAQVSQLTKELDAHKKTQRKLERKTLLLEKKLEHILEREVTAQQTLSEVLKVRQERTAEACATPLCQGEVKLMLGLCGHMLCHACAHRAYEDKCPLCLKGIATIVMGEMSMEPNLLEAIHLAIKEVFNEEKNNKAEQTAEERDSFEEFAKSQEVKQRKSKSLIQQGDLSIIDLQEKLKQNKKKLNHKVACVTGRLNEKEKEVNKMKEDYEQEINRLRELVREKQRRMEAIMGERRVFDQQLDMVWRKADLDNQQMKNTVRENYTLHEDK